ncbi:Asp/Glu/Hydantoin racemase-domain-containing protein [Aspergillus sergii]|uniref:Asp/Glu/Hydantoin racemase-domain-containing protein n=1 Tax=Aspergillus sergii TaxID=1034303 RepID=A0A5N6WU88_9EURO|nr:Asp/Glu/Hydantoin racemase-domain-containing protein [Aspergillus sergii]
MATDHADVILPRVSGSSKSRLINILLVNPNSSEYMTKDCLTSLAPSLPSDVIVHGFTAPYPAPTAIESQTDAVLSTEACIRAIKPIADDYDAFLVACFRAHPLIAVLKEEFAQPVLGIMEAAMYTARILGGNMGIICTSERSAAAHGRIVAEYGFSNYFAGCEAAKLGVLELDSEPRAEVHTVITQKIHHLVHEKGADCVLLGCAGMAEMRAICAASVEGSGARVLDGVGLGVQLLVGLVREGLQTSKNGIFRDSALDRAKRMQDWL